MEPMLRFKADDGSDFPDWEEKTLGDICMYERQRSEGANFVGTENMLKDFGGVTFDNSNADGSGTLYYPGDTLMSNIRPYLKKAWLADRKGTCSTDVLVFHPTSVEPGYLYWLIASDAFVRYVMSAAKGSKMPRGDKKHIMEMPLLLPNKDEQRKIADLLSTVDDVISAQEAEVAAWEKRKKGVMQKLFSQEVRFKADDGSDFPDWEEKTLGDLGYFIRGLSYNKTQVLDDGSDASGTAVLRSNNINSDGTLDYRDDVQLVSKEPSSEQQLCENDVVICMANGSNRLVGKAARYDGGYDARRITVGAFCGIFRTDSPLVPWWFQSDDYKSFLHLSKQGGDGALANLKGKDIEAISLLFPSSSTEQREIADCLASLDDVIAKAKDELDAWRELKKGLLQQMFV